MTTLMRFSFAILFLTLGCKKDNSTDPPHASFPLNIGNTWSYTRAASWSNFRPRDTTVPSPIEAIAGSAVMTVRGDTVFVPLANGQTSVTVQIVTTQEQISGPVNSQFSGVEYLKLQPEGLYVHGYATPGGFMLKSSPSVAGFLGGPFRASTMRVLLKALGVGLVMGMEGEITREDAPIKTLAFPLLVGTTWTYRSSGNPFRIDKSVEGTSTTTVAGHAYPCSVVLYLYDINGDGAWDT